MEPAVIRVLSTIGWAFLGVALLYGGVRLYDFVDPIDYQQEVKNGNMAAAVIVSALTLALAAIIVSVIVV